MMDELLVQTRKTVISLIGTAVGALLFLAVPVGIHDINGFDYLSFWDKYQAVLFGLLGCMIAQGSVCLGNIRKIKGIISPSLEENAE
ncbi:MAG: hypothetical protein HUJ66_08300 [Oscillospiraceae bacterium]|nr:hypothetical protein [Oscillospiraceae bacterium]